MPAALGQIVVSIEQGSLTVVSFRQKPFHCKRPETKGLGGKTQHHIIGIGMTVDELQTAEIRAPTGGHAYAPRRFDAGGTAFVVHQQMDVSH